MSTTATATSTHREEISALERRIAKAQSDRDAARAAGLQERYVAACLLLEVLDLQLAARAADAADRADGELAELAPNVPPVAMVRRFRRGRWTLQPA